MYPQKEKNKAGDTVADSEKTSTDKKRDRRLKKKVKHFKVKEKEKRQKLKEASNAGVNKKLSKAEVAENLKKVTKGGKATIMKVSTLSCVPSNIVQISWHSQVCVCPFSHSRKTESCFF